MHNESHCIIFSKQLKKKYSHYSLFYTRGKMISFLQFLHNWQSSCLHSTGLHKSEVEISLQDKEAYTRTLSRSLVRSWICKSPRLPRLRLTLYNSIKKGCVSLSRSKQHFCTEYLHRIVTEAADSVTLALGFKMSALPTDCSQNVQIEGSCIGCCIRRASVLPVNSS